MFVNQTEDEKEEVIFKRDSRERNDLHYKEGRKSFQ